MKSKFTQKAPGHCFDVTARPFILASKLIAVLLLMLFFGAVRSYAQAPNISYSSPQVYNPFYTYNAAYAHQYRQTGLCLCPIMFTSQNAPGDPITYMAIDSAKNFYVCMEQYGYISKITPGNTETKVVQGLSNPSGVAVDKAGNVYVADNGGNSIIEIFASDGSTKTLLSLSSPKGMAIDTAGTIYFCVGTSVYKLLKGHTSRLTVATGFTRPVSVAVDFAGNVYVADPGANRYGNQDFGLKRQQSYTGHRLQRGHQRGGR